MSGILLGLGQLAQPMALLALLGGVVIGLIVGSLPGLNDSITMAVLIPITFGMEPCVAICLLIGIYCASACGGSVPSILLKIPGTASATVTAYDGYPMSQKGKSGEALGLAISSSTFGGISLENTTNPMNAATRPGMIGWLTLMPNSTPLETCSRYTTTMVPASKEAMVPAVDAFFQ